MGLLEEEEGRGCTPKQAWSRKGPEALQGRWRRWHRGRETLGLDCCEGFILKVAARHQAHGWRQGLEVGTLGLTWGEAGTSRDPLGQRDPSGSSPLPLPRTLTLLILTRAAWTGQHPAPPAPPSCLALQREQGPQTSLPPGGRVVLGPVIIAQQEVPAVARRLKIPRCLCRGRSSIPSPSQWVKTLSSRSWDAGCGCGSGGSSIPGPGTSMRRGCGPKGRRKPRRC